MNNYFVDMSNINFEYLTALLHKQNFDWSLPTVPNSSQGHLREVNMRLAMFII